MSDETGSKERHDSLWAPWRMEYIDALDDGDDGCFLCRYRDEDTPQADARNLVVWRGPRTFVVMNRFPYTGGHMLIAPYEHVPSLDGMDAETLREIMEMLRDVQKILDATVHAQGYNIGMNIGRCAGAGLPGHLHLHMVPRWEGDTNFMTVLGGVRVIPEALETLYGKLRQTGQQLQLPNPTP